MGDLSPIKILVVLVVALVVLGPEKLPDMARKAGRTWNDLRRFRDHMHSEVREVIGDVPGLDQVHRLPGIRSTVAASLLAPPPQVAAPGNGPGAEGTSGTGGPPRRRSAPPGPEEGSILDPGDPGLN